jgi:hypothetical protein
MRSRKSQISGPRAEPYHKENEENEAKPKHKALRVEKFSHVQLDLTKCIENSSPATRLSPSKEGLQPKQDLRFCELVFTTKSKCPTGSRA